VTVPVTVTVTEQKAGPFAVFPAEVLWLVITKTFESRAAHPGGLTGSGLPGATVTRNVTVTVTAARRLPGRWPYHRTIENEDEP
jgi:hypothetical protein